MNNLKSIKVTNMESPRTGQPAANQYEIRIGDGINNPLEYYFQSYQSIIVRKLWNGEKWAITLDKNYWDYSVTTGKYRNQFLGENKKETEKKIKSGEYTLEDLNG